MTLGECSDWIAKYIEEIRHVKITKCTCWIGDSLPRGGAHVAGGDRRYAASVGTPFRGGDNWHETMRPLKLISYGLEHLIFAVYSIDECKVAASESIESFRPRDALRTPASRHVNASASRLAFKLRFHPRRHTRLVAPKLYDWPYTRIAHYRRRRAQLHVARRSYLHSSSLVEARFGNLSSLRKGFTV